MRTKGRFCGIVRMERPIAVVFGFLLEILPSVDTQVQTEKMESETSTIEASRQQNMRMIESERDGGGKEEGERKREK